jgi:hypothetical protein
MCRNVQKVEDVCSVLFCVVDGQEEHRVLFCVVGGQEEHRMLFCVCVWVGGWVGVGYVCVCG